jgi:hypothetical protein
VLTSFADPLFYKKLALKRILLRRINYYHLFVSGLHTARSGVGRDVATFARTWLDHSTPDMGLRSGTAIIFCINAKDDELCEAVPDLRLLFEEKRTPWYIRLRC